MALILSVGKRAVINMKPMQPDDVTDTHADTTLLHRLTDFRPQTSIGDDVKAFVEWYLAYDRK